MGAQNNAETRNGGEFKAFGLGFVGPGKTSGNISSGGRHLYESGVWNANLARSESDVFLVSYKIESTWVPGMEKNR